jgi:hypothetical protein
MLYFSDLILKWSKKDGFYIIHYFYYVLRSLVGKIGHIDHPSPFLRDHASPAVKDHP